MDFNISKDPRMLQSLKIEHLDKGRIGEEVSQIRHHFVEAMFCSKSTGGLRCKVELRVGGK